MTRGRLVWFAILAVGLAVGLWLRAPKRERVADPAPERRVAPSASGNAEDLVEVELADAREISPQPRASTGGADDPADEAELLFFEIKALVADGRIGKARSKAERYLELYPPGPMTDEVERLTGVHRRPPL